MSAIISNSQIDLDEKENELKRINNLLEDTKTIIKNLQSNNKDLEVEKNIAIAEKSKQKGDLSEIICNLQKEIMEKDTNNKDLDSERNVAIEENIKQKEENCEQVIEIEKLKELNGKLESEKTQEIEQKHKQKEDLSAIIQTLQKEIDDISSKAYKGKEALVLEESNKKFSTIDIDLYRELKHKQLKLKREYIELLPKGFEYQRLSDICQNNSLKDTRQNYIERLKLDTDNLFEEKNEQRINRLFKMFQNNLDMKREERLMVFRLMK